MSILDDLNIKHIIIDNDTYVSLNDISHHLIGILQESVVHEAYHMNQKTLKERIFFAGVVEGAAIVANAMADISELQYFHTSIKNVDDFLKKMPQQDS